VQHTQSDLDEFQAELDNPFGPLGGADDDVEVIHYLDE
jgi:hypothetical protein